VLFRVRLTEWKIAKVRDIQCATKFMMQQTTLADAQLSMVLRLSSLNDYERRINNIVREKYLEGSTIQPFIIIQASSELEFLDFYVYFDKTLVKCDSFLKSIDLCFKCFMSYSLSYPKASEQAWYAVQKIIFEIDTAYDIRSLNLQNLIDFMNKN